MSEIKYPDIEVELVGKDGNAFNVLGLVSRAMRQGGCTTEEIEAYQNEATSGDYDHLLRVTMNTVSVS